MANRIKELNGLSVGLGGGSPLESIRPSNPAGSATTGDSPSPAGAGSVEITAGARLLASLSQAVQNVPEVDPARVSTLQQAIASGQYHVDPDQTATRLLRLEEDLGGTQGQ